MSRPLRVFLCHASQDKPAVRELYQRLDSEGWMDVWLDEEKLYPGQDWDFEIEKAVEAADVVIVCLSNNSVTKEGYVQRELRFVLQIADYKSDGTIFVVPVRLDDCPLPRRLKIWQYIDFFPKNRMDWAYRRLLGSLQMRAENLGLNPKENERTEHEAAEKAAREQAEREAAERLARKETARRQTVQPSRKQQETPTIFQNLPDAILKYGKPWIWFGSIFLLGLLFLGINALLSREPLTPPEQSTATVTITPTVPTRTPTATRTPAPPTFTPTPGIGSTMISEKDGMVMVFVPAGEFTMGSDVESDKQPIRQVYLDAFWIDQTEVTNAMYAKCVDGGGCTPPSGLRSSSRGSYYGNSEFDDFPVIYVNWNQANAYCAWAGRSLPTEAQWEKAARGTDGFTYPWGDASPNNTLLNYNQNVGDTTEVGSYPAGASPYGAYDMAGNVWEWVSDWYSGTYYQSSPSSNPTGPSSGQYRVLRGGAWINYVDGVRSALRVRFDPTNSDSGLGFRCALSQP